MPFEQIGLNYAQEYSAVLANQYPYLSYFADLWNGPNAGAYRPVHGKTVLIPSMEVSGSRAVNRDRIDGVFNRNFNQDLQPVTMSMDREWDTLVDPMDMNEAPAVTVANITRTYVETQKVPEMDAYAASKLAGFAGGFGTVDTTALTSANILATWDSYLAYMINNRIPVDRIRCKMTPDVYKLLKEAAGITRFVDSGSGERNVDRRVGALDGVRIEQVPGDIMQTAFDFTEGWTPAAGSKAVNMLMYDPLATVAPIVYDTSMISAPTAQSKGKYLYYERYYYDVFALNQRRAGILANLAGNPALGVLAVTSVAGPESGQTVVTVDTPKVFGTSFVYKLGSSAQTVTYGEAPGSGWTKLVPGTPIAASSNTTITVAQVNDTKGGIAIASGSATIVKKN